MAIAMTTTRRLLGATRAIPRVAPPVHGGPALHLYCDALSAGRLRSDDDAGVEPCTRCKRSHLGDGPGASGSLPAGAVGAGKSLLIGAGAPRRRGAGGRGGSTGSLMIDVHARLPRAAAGAPRRTVVLTEQRQRVFKYDDADDGVDHAAPLDAVVRAIAAETQLLCGDEVQVTDVADALVLRQLI